MTTLFDKLHGDGSALANGFGLGLRLLERNTTNGEIKRCERGQAVSLEFTLLEFVNLAMDQVDRFPLAIHLLKVIKGEYMVIVGKVARLVTELVHVVGKHIGFSRRMRLTASFARLHARETPPVKHQGSGSLEAA